MSEEDLRDCFAMFAMQALLRVDYEDSGYRLPLGVAEDAYTVADAMIAARKPKQEAGLPAIRRRTKKGE